MGTSLPVLLTQLLSSISLAAGEFTPSMRLTLMNKSGLLALSGHSDSRDIEDGAHAGDRTPACTDATIVRLSSLEVGPGYARL